MIISSILSDRHYETRPSWSIVYEWEDELASHFNLPLRNTPIRTSSLYNFYYRAERKLFNGYLSNLVYDLLMQKDERSLYFEMHPKTYRSFSNSRHTIPIIIDFWKLDMSTFIKLYERCPYVLVTSLEVLNLLRKKGFRKSLVHFPMSLPSKYELKPNQQFEKKFDIVLAGRMNSILLEYLEKYVKKYPRTEYLKQKWIDGELYYLSNLKGTYRKVHSREDYNNLLRASRVTFYATPGMDSGEERTGGFNPVTPRLFELLAGGCHVIARYPRNIESDYFALDKISPSVQSYDDFEKQLIHALNTPPPISRNAEYLAPHYTCNRFKILKSIS